MFKPICGFEVWEHRTTKHRCIVTEIDGQIVECYGINGRSGLPISIPSLGEDRSQWKRIE
jgi:hypothetical protein